MFTLPSQTPLVGFLWVCCCCCWGSGYIYIPKYVTNIKDLPWLLCHLPLLCYVTPKKKQRDTCSILNAYYLYLFALKNSSVPFPDNPIHRITEGSEFQVVNLTLSRPFMYQICRNSLVVLGIVQLTSIMLEDEMPNL